MLDRNNNQYKKRRLEKNSEFLYTRAQLHWLPRRKKLSQNSPHFFSAFLFLCVGFTAALLFFGGISGGGAFLTIIPSLRPGRRSPPSLLFSFTH